MNKNPHALRKILMWATSSNMRIPWVDNVGQASEVSCRNTVVLS